MTIRMNHLLKLIRKGETKTDNAIAATTILIAAALITFGLLFGNDIVTAIVAVSFLVPTLSIACIRL